MSRLSVQEALRSAPPFNPTRPHVTPQFIELTRVRDFVWTPRGIYERSRLGAVPSQLIIWDGCGTRVWWIGNAASRVTVDEDTFAALRNGRATADGGILCGGRELDLVPIGGAARLCSPALGSVALAPRRP